MSSSKDFAENFRQLKIVPLSISYEWEPCDDLKTNELYTKTVSEYIKTPEEDMKSMQTGLAMYKGRINFVVDKPIDDELDAIASLPSNGERLESLPSSLIQKFIKTLNYGRIIILLMIFCILSINFQNFITMKKKKNLFAQ